MKMNRQTTSWGYIDWLQSKAYDKNAQYNIGLVHLMPRTSQAEHAHYTETQFLYTMEGHGEHVIDGQSYQFQPGDYFFLPCGITHKTINHSDEMLVQLLFSMPVHIDRSPHTAIKPLHKSDPEFTREALRQGIDKLVEETLTHLNIPLVITDDEHHVIHGSRFSGTCQSCSGENCPIDGKYSELHLENAKACASVVCPKGLTVLVQPIAIDGVIYFHIKGGLFHEYPNVTDTDEDVYDVPGSTVTSMQILLEDIRRYLRDFYRKKKVEREIDEEQRHSKALTEAVEETKTNALNLRIRNHFLFNTLNSIASLAVRDGSMDTYKAIVDLSELLRGTLQQEGARVPLSEELVFLQRYLNLQELRHEDNLQITWNRCSSAEHVIIPHNFLQPIVENSFVHGFKNMTETKKLCIETKLENNHSVITIQDNGCGMEADRLRQLRIALHAETAPHGLGMVYRKLTGVFGTDFTFDIDSVPGCGTTYRLSFPV